MRLTANRASAPNSSWYLEAEIGNADLERVVQEVIGRPGTDRPFEGVVRGEPGGVVFEGQFTLLARIQNLAVVRVQRVVKAVAAKADVAVQHRAGRVPRKGCDGSAVHTSGSAWMTFQRPTGVRYLPRRRLTCVVAR